MLFEPAEANVVSIPTGDAPDIADCRQLSGRLALVAKRHDVFWEAHPISACITPAGILASPITGLSGLPAYPARCPVVVARCNSLCPDLAYRGGCIVRVARGICAAQLVFHHLENGSLAG